MSNPTELPDLEHRTNGMADDELIAYCQSHCETERALFNEDQVNRMIQLAGYPHWCVRKVNGWISLHGNMAKLCELALARRAQPEGELDELDLRDPWVVAARKADHLCPSELSSPDRWRWKAAYMRGQLSKPEGEAPQAIQSKRLREEEVREIALQHLHDDTESAGRNGWFTFSAEGLDGFAIDLMDRIAAAQHAESGAPAPDAERVDAIVTGLYLRFKDWSKRGFSADDVTWCEVKADVVALISAGAAESGAQATDFQSWFDGWVNPDLKALNRSIREHTAREAWNAALSAQSQGAQPDAWAVVVGEDMANTIHLTVDAEEAKAEYEASVEGGFESIYNLFPLYRSAALAAKAEAPAPGDLALLAALADAADVFMKGGVAPLRPLLDRAKAVTSRAQQAAAPGALALLNADEMAALRRFDETCQDGEGYDVPKEMMQRLAAIGVVRRTSGSIYEQTSFGLHALGQPAPSAPGTPEAPADQDAARYQWLKERFTGYDFYWGGDPMAEREEDKGKCVIVFECGQDFRAGRDFEPAIDAAIRRAAQLDGGQGEGEKA